MLPLFAISAIFIPLLQTAGEMVSKNRFDTEPSAQDGQ
jgi:hypothetical protein